jgi:uncharacterized membrane-anchored protein
VAENRIIKGGEAFYWGAIIITRTAATNLADFATHALKLEFGGVIHVLVGLMAVVLLFGTGISRSIGRRQGLHDWYRRW